MNQEETYIRTATSHLDTILQIERAVYHAVRQIVPGADEATYAAAQAGMLLLITQEPAPDLELKRSHEDLVRVADLMSPVLDAFNEHCEREQTPIETLEKIFVQFIKHVRLCRAVLQEWRLKLQAAPGMPAQVDLRSFSDDAGEYFSTH